MSQAEEIREVREAADRYADRKGYAKTAGWLRAYADLLENGQEVWWCVALKKTSEPRLCGRGEGRSPSSAHSDCGSRLVVEQ